jgi:threonine aldolase
MLGIRTYLDGARLFNAAVATGATVATLSVPFDVVSVALSKGLGCPVGSVIAGSKADMGRAVRIRRMFGGAMRQAGILAAAGLYALDNNLTRLEEDHANARTIAATLTKVRGVRLNVKTVQSNIVIFHMEEGAPDAATIAARAKEAGVLVSIFGARKLRAVTHLDVSREDCARAAGILAEVIGKA